MTVLTVRRVHVPRWSTIGLASVGLSTALVAPDPRIPRASGLLRERRSGGWIFYSLDLERLAGLRAAIAGLLTLTDVAATAHAWSDRGTSKTIPADLGPRRRMPILAETLQ
ncbi:MAG: hypothetical protein HY262_02160 [Chloroflexi bacterium]|nr:hypothetical protein [Chloroflexota bacterium]